MKFLIINGPNLNLMHFTEPGVAGQIDYNEGDLIDEIQSAAGRVDGIVINPGGYAHYSVAILDALRVCGVPAVEVMLSEPDSHEPFRQTDVVSFGCQGHFIGEGISGYLHACAYLVQLLRIDGSGHTHLVM